MKTLQPAALALLSAFSLQPSALLHAASTIDATNHYAYAANLGWVEARGDAANGAVIGEYVCSGSIYSANVGWISLGDGTPANLIQYQNNSASDFGVNHDGLGNLRGYAYGANIGWINFEATGAPKVNLLTGGLSGHAWSANCGWISLSNATAHVKTTRLAAAPDTDGDGMADAWERIYWAGLGHTGNLDTDGDGASDRNEYLSGTNPTNSSSVLRITSFARGQYGVPTRVDISWEGVASRQYAIHRCPDLATNDWSDYISIPAMGGPDSHSAFPDTSTTRFYRIRAYRPLMP